jgi:predicted nucleic acid-binding protein
VKRRSVLKIKLELDALNKGKRNNWHDAIIAQTALVNGYALMTDDYDLAEVAKRYGIQVIYSGCQIN